MKFYKYIFFYFIALFTIESYGQLLLHDDFKNQKDDWYWRKDGNQERPTVNNGLLHLQLLNAINSEYCNTEIYNTDKIYTPGTEVRVRLKTSDIHNGSRGWGFWDGKLDILSLIYDYDVAWVMQQGSKNSGENYNWFLFGVDGDTLTNRKTLDLNNLVDETQWHTYKIIWDIDKVEFYVDDNFLYKTSQHLPNEEMRMDIWIDNRIINLTNPLEQWHSEGKDSEIFVDFVEITNIGGPSIERNFENNILLWDSPNTFPNGEKEVLWKDYNFNITSNGEALIFITGSAEKYSDTEDDNLKIVLDENDFGWGPNNSFNGFELNGESKSIVVPTELSSGDHSLKIFSDITPYLRDVIVLYAPEGKTLFTKHYNEQSLDEDGLWKTIEFENDEKNEITFLISGVAEKETGLRIELDNIDFGWDNDYSINGDYLKGLPNTVAIDQTIEAGTHKLKVYNKGEAKLLSIAAYGSSTITDINSGKIIPNDIYFSANPNPFNASTNINYTTSIASHNKLKIFNILGKEIATLLDQYQPSGNYSINWDANNVTSGIYFCILESNSYFKVQKLVLLK